ncbi:hypothetical protein Mth01_57590 [Sphaerimonospora thailandensis]|uniref:Uncharacterized protein n=1 Tax=Sphaerimonospora thailandensis TaxID=795644 RepID=A0A8J3RFW3_9ACTN|nr:hypothetical protein Mth01_57590 [Sphaerimonospora thailandensis]
MPLLVVTVVGALNRLVFSLTRGRIVLYKFTGMPAVTLMIAGPEVGYAERAVLPCLPDGEMHVVLKYERDTPPEYVQLMGRGVSVFIDAGADASPVVASPVRENPDELLAHLLENVSFLRRCEVRASRMVPFARLEPDSGP